MSLVYETNSKQYHIGLGEGEVGKYVIMPGDPGRVKAIAAYLDDARFVASNREYTTYTGTLLGEKVSVVSTGIGGPSASIALEELVKLGAHTFIRVGTSGGMDENVLSGDLVIGQAAIRAEGTTREYAPLEYPAVADFNVITALKNAADKLGMRNHVGVLHCKDSFYGQHSPQLMPVADKLLSDWNAYLMLGAKASEMESAALFIVGAFHRVRVGSVMMVLANQTRRQKGLSDSVTRDTDKAIHCAIEAMRQLIESDRQER